jgi:hypothetical protein
MAYIDKHTNLPDYDIIHSSGVFYITGFLVGEWIGAPKILELLVSDSDKHTSLLVNIFIYFGEKFYQKLYLIWKQQMQILLAQARTF